MVILQVINKVFVFFSPKEILLDTNTYSISTPFEKIRIFMRWAFFNLNIAKR